MFFHDPAGNALEFKSFATRPALRQVTELLFIRHGETDWNRQQRFQARSTCR